MKMYRAENLKYRHSFTGILWFLMQLLTLALAYGISRGNGISSAYNWWYTLMLPGMLTLVVCLIGEKDRKMKNRAVLSLPVRTGCIWDAKILVGIKSLLLANLFGAAANLILGQYLLPRFWIPQVLELTPLQIAAAAAVMTVTALWQIPFCLWMDQKWGMLPTMIVNIILNGSGTFMAVTTLWMMNPWAVRLRHTALSRVHLILPAAGAAVFLGYYSVSKWDSAAKVQAYLQVVACVWPFLCGVLCGMAEEMEADCGYQNFFLLPGRKFQALLMKWLILFLAGFPACIIAVFGFAAVYRIFPDGTVYGMAIYLGAAVVIWIGQAVVYLLHLVLAFLFGKGVSIGVGVMGSLSAFLMLTGLGDGIWMFFPWSWSGRSCSCLLLYMAGKSDGAVINPMIKTELGICAVIFAFLTAAAFLWVSGYEGRKSGLD